MKTALSLFMLGTSVVFSSVALGQLSVDATGPVRQRAREGSLGRGGGVGRKIPLQVAIAVIGDWDADGMIEVDFTLTNTGRDALTIPISPNPGDLEPVDAAGYKVKRLTLRVTSSEMSGGVLPGGADLYGSPRFPETLTTVASGASVRVLTRVSLPHSADAVENVFMASAILNDETIKTVDGKTLSDLREIGSAYSPEYRLRSLLKPSD